MPIAFVSQIGTLANGASSSTIVIPVGAAGVAAGNLVVVCASAKGTSSIVTGCVDSKGNTYRIAIQARGGNGGNVEPVICWSVLAKALVNGDTITVTYSGATTSQAGVALEFSGAANDPFTVDRVDAQNSNLTANPTTPALSSTTDDALVVCTYGLELGGGDTFTASAGFTAQSLTAVGTATFEGLYTEYRIGTAIGSFQGAPHDVTSTRGTESLIAIFRAAAPVVLPADVPVIYLRKTL